jgi:hypothetical protein
VSYWERRRQQRDRIVKWTLTTIFVRRLDWLLWDWSVLGYHEGDHRLHGEAGYAFTRRGAMRCVRRIILTR